MTGEHPKALEAPTAEPVVIEFGQGKICIAAKANDNGTTEFRFVPLPAPQEVGSEAHVEIEEVPALAVLKFKGAKDLGVLVKLATKLLAHVESPPSRWTVVLAEPK